MNLGPRPHMKNSANAYKMEEEDARELFDQVFCTQIPRVMHEYFCVPQYTGWEDETINYVKGSGLFPREREHAYQLGKARQEVNARYDADLEKFLRAKRVKILHINQLDQFVAHRRRQHVDFDKRPAFRRRPRKARNLGWN